VPDPRQVTVGPVAHTPRHQRRGGGGGHALPRNGGGLRPWRPHSLAHPQPGWQPRELQVPRCRAGLDNQPGQHEERPGQGGPRPRGRAGRCPRDQLRRWPGGQNSLCTVTWHPGGTQPKIELRVPAQPAAVRAPVDPHYPGRAGLLQGRAGFRVDGTRRRVRLAALHSPRTARRYSRLRGRQLRYRSVAPDRYRARQRSGNYSAQQAVGVPGLFLPEEGHQ
jgi:hypothetical protein